jgi:hypothetical protein
VLSGVADLQVSLVNFGGRALEAKLWGQIFGVRPLEVKLLRE